MTSLKYMGMRSAYFCLQKAARLNPEDFPNSQNVLLELSSKLTKYDIHWREKTKQLTQTERAAKLGLIKNWKNKARETCSNISKFVNE